MQHNQGMPRHRRQPGRLIMPLWLAMGLLCLSAAGCASTVVTVDFDSEADFASYKTFAWRDSNEDLLDSDLLFHKHVVQGIEQRLQAAGLKKVAHDPDLYVTYYSAEKQKTVIYTSSAGHGYYGPYGYSGPPSVRHRSVTFTLGTLAIDIWDARESKLVWRGTAEDTVTGDLHKDAEKVDKALDQLVKRWEKAYRKQQQVR